MRKWKVWLAIAILGGLAWVLFFSERSEPVYQGKPLHYWLAAYDSLNYNAAHLKGPPAPTRTQADEAIRHMGSNAIPTLLRMLRERDAPFKTRLIALAQKQHFFPVEYSSPETQNIKALIAFDALGPQTTDIAPQLAEIYESNPSGCSRQVVPAILVYAAPNAPETVDLLFRALHDTNDIWVRNNAAAALCQIHSKPDLVVPALTKALSDPDSDVQAKAAAALANFESAAQPSVPTLIKRIAQEEAKGIVAKPLPITTGFHFGPPQPLSTGPDRGLSAPEALYSMKEALKRIDPEAAAKAGVK